MAKRKIIITVAPTGGFAKKKIILIYQLRLKKYQIVLQSVVG